MRRSSKSEHSKSPASTQSLSSATPRVRIGAQRSPGQTDSVTDVISIPLGRHDYSDGEEEEEEMSDSESDSESLSDEEESESESYSDGSQAEEVDDEEESEGSEMEEEEEGGENIRGVQRQDAVGVSIPKQDFRQIVREIGSSFSETGSIRFSTEAMDLLQSEAEKVLVELFTGANALAEAAGRDEVKVSDVYATRQVNEILKKSDS